MTDTNKPDKPSKVLDKWGEPYPAGEPSAEWLAAQAEKEAELETATIERMTAIAKENARHA